MAYRMRCTSCRPSMSLQIIYDHLYIFAVVNSDFNATVEDAIVAADGELVYVDIELVADDTAERRGASLAVDALVSRW